MNIAYSKGLIAGLALGASLFASSVHAEGLPITPGLWEITTHNSMLGSQEVEQSCMTETVFDPVSMMGEEAGCEVTNERVQGNSVDYDIICVDDAAAGKAEGHFAFTIDGDRGDGKIDLTMTVGDQSMSMQYSMDAKRIGDC